jgi:hypothetical protein
MAAMVSSSRGYRPLFVALIVAASVAVAGCSAGLSGAAAITTTAVIRLPSGFHAARPTDDTTTTRSMTKTRRVLTESATLRLEGAHRRAAAAAAAADAELATSGGFVCQIDMGTAPSD